MKHVTKIKHEGDVKSDGHDGNCGDETNDDGNDSDGVGDETNDDDGNGANIMILNAMQCTGRCGRVAKSCEGLCEKSNGEIPLPRNYSI